MAPCALPGVVLRTLRFDEGTVMDVAIVSQDRIVLRPTVQRIMQCEDPAAARRFIHTVERRCPLMRHIAFERMHDATLLGGTFLAADLAHFAHFCRAAAHTNYTFQRLVAQNRLWFADHAEAWLQRVCAKHPHLALSPYTPLDPLKRAASPLFGDDPVQE